MIKTPAELNEIRRKAKEILQGKVSDYADTLCTEITSMMLDVAARPGRDGNNPTSVKLDLSTNSKMESIDIMRKKKDVKYLIPTAELMGIRFANLGYEVETFTDRDGHYYCITISWGEENANK